MSMTVVWADLAATTTALAAIGATIAATFAGFYAKKAYETTQGQLRTDQRALEVAQTQLRASQQPFIIPRFNPRFMENRPDLIAVGQSIEILNIGRGPAFNIRVTLCGKKPPYIEGEYYGLLETILVDPLGINENVFKQSKNAGRKPKFVEYPLGYNNAGSVTESIARLTITYSDISLFEYQTIYEWKDNYRWELQKMPQIDV